MSPFSFCLSNPLPTTATPPSPHTALLLGFLLFPGWHVCPDHVGDAAHSGWLCAEVQRPRSLSRLVSFSTYSAMKSLQLTGRVSHPCIHYSYLHQSDAVTIKCYNLAAFSIDLFWSLFLCDISGSVCLMGGVIQYKPRWWLCITFLLLQLFVLLVLLHSMFTLCCRVGDPSKFIGHFIQQIWPAQVHTVCPTPGVLPAK